VGLTLGGQERTDIDKNHLLENNFMTSHKSSIFMSKNLFNGLNSILAYRKSQLSKGDLIGERYW